MAEDQLYELHAKICRTLAHPRRLMIIDCLREGEICVSDLAKELGIAQATISRHLGSMRHLGVVLDRREGQNVYYRLASPRIITAYDTMHQFSMEYLQSRVELMQAGFVK
jgi:ArsR family transcriptional regulator